MMREGKHGDFVLLRKEDDVVWKPAQNESLNAGLAERPGHRHRRRSAGFKKVEARVKCPLEPPPQSRALRLIPVNRRLRFIRSGQMDSNNGHGWLSKAPLQPLAQLYSAKRSCSPLLHIRQPDHKLLFPRLRCIGIGSAIESRKKIMGQLCPVRFGEGFDLVPELFEVRACHGASPRCRGMFGQYTKR